MYNDLALWKAYSRSETVSFGLVCLTVSNPQWVRPAGTPPDRLAPKEIVYMRVKNFDKFQHFKDRCPPWVKLYRDILDDIEWFELDPKAAKILVMLWLIASEDETKQGLLPGIKQLSFRLRITETELKNSISKLSHWLIQDDIDLISDRNQYDAPEKSREETEKNTRAARFDFVGALISEGVSESIAKDYVSVRKAKKCVQTETAFKLFSEEVNKAGLSFSDAVSICCKKNWGGFEAGWIKPEDKQSQSGYQLPDFMRGAI